LSACGARAATQRVRYVVLSREARGVQWRNENVAGKRNPNPQTANAPFAARGIKRSGKMLRQRKITRAGKIKMNQAPR